jgi:hypothetical protein
LYDPQEAVASEKPTILEPQPAMFRGVVLTVMGYRDINPFEEDKSKTLVKEFIL